MSGEKQVEGSQSNARTQRNDAISSIVENIYKMKSAIETLEREIETKNVIINALASKVSDADLQILGLSKVTPTESKGIVKRQIQKRVLRNTKAPIAKKKDTK